MSTNLKTLLLKTNLFRNQYFSVNQSDLRERKERNNKLFRGLRSWPKSSLKNTAQPEKRDIFMKNGSEGRDVLLGRDKKIWTALRTNQIAGFLTVPSEKKKMINMIKQSTFQFCAFIVSWNIFWTIDVKWGQIHGVCEILHHLVCQKYFRTRNKYKATTWKIINILIWYSE